MALRNTSDKPMGVDGKSMAEEDRVEADLRQWLGETLRPNVSTMERCCTACAKHQPVAEFASQKSSKLFAMCRTCRVREAEASACAFRREKGDPACFDPSSVTFTVNPQPAVVYPLLPHYFAIPYGESNPVELETGTAGTSRTAFGVIILKRSARLGGAVAITSMRREAKAAVLQEAMSMLELEDEESEQDD